MSTGPLILWLLTELWGLCLTPAAAETVVTAFLGQPVTLPCMYTSWSKSRNSMCWGKGACPNSKCNEELLHTDGTQVISRRSSKYQLQGDIWRGDVSLTISNTDEGDSSVYCCRIEVPGWFNDVKMNIRLQLREAPRTTRRPTTRRPTTRRPTTTITTTATTTTSVATTTAMLPTTALTTPDLTTRTPLPTRASTSLAVMTTTCPLTRPRSLPEAAQTLPTTEPPTAEPILTAESETFFLSEGTSGDTHFLPTTAPAAAETVVTAFLGQLVTLPCMYTPWSKSRNSMCWGKGACPNSKCNEELLHTDGTQVISRRSSKYQLQGDIWRGDVSLTISNTDEGDSSVYCCLIEVPGWFNDVKMNIRLQLREGSETTAFVEQKQVILAGSSLPLEIIASSLGLVLCACVLTVAFLLRGKVMKTNCFQKHTRVDSAGESDRNILNDMQQGREDEDALFTL